MPILPAPIECSCILHHVFHLVDLSLQVEALGFIHLNTPGPLVDASSSLFGSFIGMYGIKINILMLQFPVDWKLTCTLS